MSGDASLLTRACSAISSAMSSGLPRMTNSRVVLASAAVMSHVYACDCARLHTTEMSNTLTTYFKPMGSMKHIVWCTLYEHTRTHTARASATLSITGGQPKHACRRHKRMPPLPSPFPIHTCLLSLCISIRG